MEYFLLFAIIRFINNSNGRNVIRRTYTTPVGSVYLEERRDPGVGQWHEQRSWRDVTPWQTKRLIAEPEDYAIMKYIVENTSYEADYFPIEQATDWLCLQTGRRYKTAVGALKAAKRRSAKLADCGIGAVEVLWSPATRIGRLVVQALIDTGDKP